MSSDTWTLLPPGAGEASFIDCEFKKTVALDGGSAEMIGCRVYTSWGE